MCREDQFLPFLESETRSYLRRLMRRNRILFVDNPISSIQVNEDIIRVAVEPSANRPNIERVFRVDLVLYSGGRSANSGGIGCENVGIEVGKYERITVDKNLRTTSSYPIYAIGDVIGPPSLASSAQQQGRTLCERLFDTDNVMSVNADSNVQDDDDYDISEVDSFFSQDESDSANLFGSLSGWCIGCIILKVDLMLR